MSEHGTEKLYPKPIYKYIADKRRNNKTNSEDIEQ